MIVLCSLFLTVFCLETCTTKQMDPKGDKCVMCANNKYCCVNYEESGVNMCTDNSTFPKSQCTSLCEIPKGPPPQCSYDQMLDSCSSCVKPGSGNKKYCCVPWDGTKPTQCSSTPGSIVKCRTRCSTTRPTRPPRKVVVRNWLEESFYFAWSGISNSSGGSFQGVKLCSVDSFGETVMVPGDTTSFKLFPLDPNTCKADNPKDISGSWTCTAYLKGKPFSGKCAHPWECLGVEGLFTSFFELDVGDSFLTPDIYGLSAEHGLSGVGMHMETKGGHSVPGFIGPKELNCGDANCDMYGLYPETCPPELRATYSASKPAKEIDICMSLGHSFEIHKQLYPNAGDNEIIKLCKSGGMGSCSLGGYGFAYDYWTHYASCTCPNGITCEWNDNWTEHQKDCKVNELLIQCRWGTESGGFPCSPTSPPATIPKYQAQPYLFSEGIPPVCSTSQLSPTQFCKEEDPQGFLSCKPYGKKKKMDYSTIFRNLCDAKGWKFDEDEVVHECFVPSSYEIYVSSFLEEGKKKKDEGEKKKIKDVEIENQNDESSGSCLGDFWMLVLLLMCFCSVV